MKEKTLKPILIAIHIILLVIPIFAAIWWTPYDISYDKHYVETVNKRALSDGYSSDKITDLSEAIVAQYDALGNYEKKVWRLENQEIYYINNIIGFSLIGILIHSLLISFFYTVIYDEIVDLEYYN
jgi:uncharacterized membrane protein (DUF106 family)